MAKKKGPLKNPRHELFCHLFVFGNPAHDPEDKTSPPNTTFNATQSYLHAGYKCNYAAARTKGSALVARGDILVRIAQLQEQKTTIQAAFTRQWKAMLPSAQEVLEKAVRGENVSPTQLNAARDIIEQAMGPTRFRFGVDKGADKDGSFSVIIGTI